jgi:protein-tyrosine-phosphatase
LHSLFILVTASFLTVVSHGQDSKEKAATEQAPTILFVCEHGAAKSVIAAAYFDKLAKERGLKHRAVFRGTNPDPALAASAVKGLNEDGIDTRGWKPELVTKKDLDAASGIVTLGCALPEKDAVAEKVNEWNGVPSVSENYQAARDDIVKRIQRFVDDLAKKEKKKR